jgi:hypothetical protein
MSRLSGRVASLEVLVIPARPAACRACGLRHVQPLTLNLLRRCIEAVRGTSPRLCLCACCADGRWLARLSHGLPPGDGLVA